MALRNIVKDGEPVLKKKCRPVTKFDKKLWQLLEDMAETMVDADGVGLAGPQVGVLRRVFVAITNIDELNHFDEENEDDGENEIDGEGVTGGKNIVEPEILEFINPEILEQEGSCMAYEGCLSFPGEYGAIERPTKVKIKAFDRHGKEFELEAEGMLARCLCHETNHLDGIVITDLAKFLYDHENPVELNAENDKADSDDGVKE